MTDKEKIRAEIERLKQYAESSKMEWIDDGYNQNAFAETCRISSFDKLLSFIDSLPEEPKIEAPYEIRFDPANGFDFGSVNIYRDGNLVAQCPEQWKWIDPKYEYPLCLTREMDEYGDWHYSLSSGKISETCQYISLAELERLPDESVDADAAMKELDEKIKLTKEHGSWEGVDVDKFMDEVRGRESYDLEEAAEEYERKRQFAPDETEPESIRKAFKAGAEWQVEQFEKNRIAACDKQTKEEYDREIDFATGIIEKEHRNPTFSDAIKYGMRLQKEQMMKDAVEGEVVKDISNKLAVTAKINLVGFKFGQKVKIIILPVEKK